MFTSIPQTNTLEGNERVLGVQRRLTLLPVFPRPVWLMCTSARMKAAEARRHSPGLDGSNGAGGSRLTSGTFGSQDGWAGGGVCDTGYWEASAEGTLRFGA